MTNQNRSKKKRISSKKTQLPFIVHRAPIENHIAYEKKGHWTQKEKLKYVIFLEYFKQKFTTRDKKKRFCKIFKLMSDFIKTRTHNQCRSHHQKMEKQRFQVDNIIKNVVSKYHPRIYKQLYERYRIEIENLEQSESQTKNFKFNTSSNSKLSSQSGQDKKQPIILEGEQIEIYKKLIGEEEQKSIPSFHQKKDQLNHNPFNLAFCTIKEPRRTRACESDSQEFPIQNPAFGLNYPIQNQLQIKRQQSLDFNSINNFYRYQSSIPPQTPSNIAEHLQNLEMKKIDCLNRANFHYNQMQIELVNLGDYERQKQFFIQSLNQQTNQQNNFPLSHSNFPWGFSQFNKQC